MLSYDWLLAWRLLQNKSRMFFFEQKSSVKISGTFLASRNIDLEIK